MKIDFLIPGSPNDEFYSQIAMFRLSLDALGGSYRDARLVAVFGDTIEKPIPEKWARHFENVEIVWADCNLFAKIGYRAQGDRRYEVMRADADLVVFCDADTLLLRPFEEDVFKLANKGAIGGVIAHYHFPWKGATGNSITDWSILSRKICNKSITTQYKYVLSDNSDKMDCPFYINLGFLVGNAASLRLLQDISAPLRAEVRELLGNYYDAQVTLALAVAMRELPAVSLPIRYNFPNDPIADEHYKSELDNVRLIHYLRTTNFDRQKIFADENEFNIFLKLKLVGSDLVLQQYVRQITRGVYPFGAAKKQRRSFFSHIFTNSAS